jgi:adenylosuccinate lyase
MGSWLQYGLGRATQDLPGFVVLITKRPVDQPLSSKLWGSGFLPTKFEGVQFRPSSDAVLFLNNPPGISRDTTRLDVLASTLVQSRLQRDLTDSSMQRNIGVALGHSLLALDNATRGLAGLDAVPAAMERDLDANWEVLGEPIQSAMRALGAQGVPGMEEPYERLKELTRGRRITGDDLREFVAGLGLPDDVAKRLSELTPQTYIGVAPELVAFLQTDGPA